MAAFSHPSFGVDSSASFVLSAFGEQPLINSTPPHHISLNVVVPRHESGCVLQASNSNMTLTDNPPSVPKSHTLPADTSVVVDKLEHGHHLTDKKENKRRNYRNGSSMEATQGRSKKQKKSNNGVVKQELKPTAEKKIPQQPPTGYIHVRARRGQATDSHSLAERVRREKISERMKMLQRLVPGCDKVTGKALVLDEIINYVQSLQNQVEFLSTKLAFVNPMFCDFTMDLDTLMARPERLNSTALPLSSMPLPECSTNQATSFRDDYLLDNSASVFLQGQRSNAFSSEDAVTQFWDVEDQRSKFSDPYGFSNNLCSFH